MNHKLAIVIPAYKAKYFKACLDSLLAQTNHNFKLYICDDGSNENLLGIVELYKGRLDYHYTRFETNLGRKDLVAHWNRSVELAKEEWIWLFSDDDLLTPNCVQAFYDALERTKSANNLYRFNIEMINSNDVVICVKERHPEIESSFNFLVRRLQSRSLSAAIEYIFRKDTFEEFSGFVNFPLATASDDASWIKFAKDLPIYTISSPVIYWRASGTNISSIRGLHKIKAKALIMYISWVLNYFPNKRNEILDLVESWYLESIRYIGGRLNLLSIYILSKELKNFYPIKNTAYFFKRIFNVKPF